MKRFVRASLISSPCYYLIRDNEKGELMPVSRVAAINRFLEFLNEEIGFIKEHHKALLGFPEGREAVNMVINEYVRTPLFLFLEDYHTIKMPFRPIDYLCPNYDESRVAHYRELMRGFGVDTAMGFHEVHEFMRVINKIFSRGGP